MFGDGRTETFRGEAAKIGGQRGAVTHGVYNSAEARGPLSTPPAMRTRPAESIVTV